MQSSQEKAKEEINAPTATTWLGFFGVQAHRRRLVHKTLEQVSSEVIGDSPRFPAFSIHVFFKQRNCRVLHDLTGTERRVSTSLRPVFMEFSE